MERGQPWVLSGCVYICLTDCILKMNIKINFNFDSFVDYYYPGLSVNAHRNISVDLKYLSFT